MDGKKGKMEHRLNIKKSLRNDYALSLPLVLALSGALILALIIFVFKEIDFSIFQRVDAVISYVESYRDRLGMDTRYYYAAQEWKKHFALFKKH